MKKKIIVVNQTDIQDCGPCCLQSVIRYYDGFIPIEKIREDTYTSLKGTTVYHLVRALNSYGFDACAKKYNQDLPSILPAIVHVHYQNGLEHFMVLYEVHNESLILMDPAKGKSLLKKVEFFKIFTGVVIEMYPKSKIVLMEKGMSLYQMFYNIILDNKKIFSTILISSVLTTILTIVSSIYFKTIYNLILDSKDISIIIFIIYLFFIVVLLKTLFEYFKNYYQNHLNKNIDVKIFSDFTNHIFKLPLKVINSHSSGEIISRINEISNIKEAFSEIIISSTLELLLSLFSLIVLFIINFKLALILCLIIIIYIISTCALNPYLYKRIKKNIDYESNVNASIIENINMLNSIKNLGKEQYALNKIENSLGNLLYDNYDFASKINSYNYFKNNITEIGIFIINTLGFYYIYQNQMEIIDLVTFNTILYYAIDPIKSFVLSIPKFNYLKASFHKIRDLMDLEKEDIGREEKFENGNITIKNLSYSYNDYHKIINNLNITIGLGEKVIIKGKSGTGKSTLCEILCGKITNYSGEIKIGDKNILDYSLCSLRKNIMYVGQRENIYTDTIENNIKLGSGSNRFDEVCKICMIEDIVKKKKFRYSFGIDNNFNNISGGEKQRIVLARALMNEWNILILDEALSELDYELERKIIKNLLKTYPDKTIIYVSHKNQDVLFKKTIILEEVHEI